MADPIGPAADDQNFSTSHSRRLAGRLVCRIEVGRPRLKFASARVDHLVRRTRSTPTDPLFRTSSERGEGLIREPGALRFGQERTSPPRPSKPRLRANGEPEFLDEELVLVTE